MITVSNKWKELHKQRFLPESFVEISLSVADNITGKWETVRYWNKESFKNSAAVVHNKDILPPMYYATLEENLWLLDGTRQILPDAEPYNNPGYITYNDKIWSDYESNGCRIQVEFTDVRTTVTPGLTITWSSEYDEYPTSFKVEALNGTRVVKTLTVTGNKSKVSYVDYDFSGYTILRITPLDWSMPNHKFRIDQIYFGHLLVFDKTNILSYTHEQSGDPLGGELSRNAIDFQVDNSDGRWDLLNPNSMTKHLSERQPVIVRYGFKTDSGVEWITGGTFYLSEWKLADDGMSISFAARDVIDFMMNAEYLSQGVPAVVNTEVTVYATPQDRYERYMHGIDVGTLGKKFEGDEIMIYDALEHWYSTTTREAMYFIGEGWVNMNGCSLLNNPYAYPMMVAAINKTIQNPLSWIYNKDLETLAMPLVVEAVDTATFMQRCVNKCGCTMWQSADGKLRMSRPSKTLTDYTITNDIQYRQATMELAKPLKQVVIKTNFRWRVEGMYDGVYHLNEEVVNISDTGETIIIDNPYVFPSEYDKGVQYIGNAYKEWWKHRGIVKGEFRADPRLELFDVISVESKYGTISPVMITYVKYTYNGAFHGTFEGKILEAITAGTVTYDAQEVETNA